MKAGPLLVLGLVTNGVNLSGGGGGDAEICANFVRRLFVITAFSADIYWIYFLFNISNGTFCQFISIFPWIFKQLKAVGYWICKQIHFSIHANWPPEEAAGCWGNVKLFTTIFTQNN